MNLREAAVYLGISPSSVWRAVKQGRVAHTHVGKRIVLTAEDLDVLAQRHRPHIELSEERRAAIRAKFPRLFSGENT